MLIRVYAVKGSKINAGFSQFDYGQGDTKTFFIIIRIRVRNDLSWL